MEFSTLSTTPIIKAITFKEKKEKYAQRALEKMEEFINGWEENFSSLS